MPLATTTRTAVLPAGPRSAQTGSCGTTTGTDARKVRRGDEPCGPARSKSALTRRECRVGRVAAMHHRRLVRASPSEQRDTRRHLVAQHANWLAILGQAERLHPPDDAPGVDQVAQLRLPGGLRQTRRGVQEAADTGLLIRGQHAVAHAQATAGLSGGTGAGAGVRRWSTRTSSRRCYPGFEHGCGHGADVEGVPFRPFP